MSIPAVKARGFDLEAMRREVESEQKQGPKKTEDCLYAELQMSETQAQAAREIINTLAQYMFQIIAKTSELKTKGKKLFGTHPFKQFAAILTDKHSSKSFTIVYNRWRVDPIRSSYFGSMKIALQDRVKENGLDHRDHLDGFAKEIGGDVGVIRQIVAASSKSSDWEPLFKYLAFYRSA